MTNFWMHTYLMGFILMGAYAAHADAILEADDGNLYEVPPEAFVDCKDGSGDLCFIVEDE